MCVSVCECECVCECVCVCVCVCVCECMCVCVLNFIETCMPSHSPLWGEQEREGVQRNCFNDVHVL